MRKRSAMDSHVGDAKDQNEETLLPTANVNTFHKDQFTHTVCLSDLIPSAKALRRVCWESLNEILDSISVSDDDDEICMYEMRHENGDLYPIHILGNGPNTHFTCAGTQEEVYETIICTWLGDYTLYEVERSSTNLYKVSRGEVGQTKHLSDVYNLEEYDSKHLRNANL